MSVQKQIKDQLIKLMLGKASVPSGLADLHNYFRVYSKINFKHEVQEDGSIVAISKDFKYGTIIASAKTEKEINEQVVDAILTAFEVPSSYKQEAAVNRAGVEGYVFA